MWRTVKTSPKLKQNGLFLRFGETLQTFIDAYISHLLAKLFITKGTFWSSIFTIDIFNRLLHLIFKLTFLLTCKFLILSIIIFADWKFQQLIICPNQLAHICRYVFQLESRVNLWLRWTSIACTTEHIYVTTDDNHHTICQVCVKIVPPETSPAQMTHSFC